MASKKISKSGCRLLSIFSFQIQKWQIRKGIAIILFVFSVLNSNLITAQPNCSVYIKNGDSSKYNICKQVVKAGLKHYQFKKEYHQIIDSVLIVFPEFAYAYREKSSPYVKTGNFIEWKKLIDKAVFYDRYNYLNVRASLRYKFFADYEGAIKDIDSLSAEVKYDIDNTSNGTYHLNIVKGLCYKALGNFHKAISIIEDQITKKQHFLGAYDYLHLGVLYLKTSQYNKAIEAFEKQEQENDIAENRYYKSKVYHKLNLKIKSKEAINLARNYYINGKKMFDPYNDLFDQITLSEIECEQKQY